MTKKQLEYYGRYANSNATYLWDVYTTFSRAKSQAFDRCIDTMYEYRGFDGKIISHNSNFFTYAFKFYSGHEQHLCVITPTKHIVFKIRA